MPRGNRRDIPGELNAGGRCGRKGAALTRGPGWSERGEGEGDAGCSGEAGERAGGSKWAAVKKGGGLGRSGWAGAGLTLVVGLFSISLFLILDQSNTFEFK